MSGDKLLGEVEYGGSPIIRENWTWEEFGGMRLYWYRDGARVDFICLNWVGNIGTEVVWDDYTDVEVVFEGWGSCYADEGIRHLHVRQQTDDELRTDWGYLYYPDTPNLCAALMRVHQLILEAGDL